MQQLARGCALLLAEVSIYSIYLDGNEFVRQTRRLSSFFWSDTLESEIDLRRKRLRTAIGSS